MKLCSCGSEIPNWVTIDGKSHNISNRTSCLKCLPFKQKKIVSEQEKLKKLKLRKNTNRKLWRNKFISQYNIDPIGLIRERNRRAILSLVNYSCQQCGYNRTSSNLVFHHLSNKQYSLDNRAFNKVFPVMIKEIIKCTIYCHNCHGEIHKNLIPLEIIQIHHALFNKELNKIINCENWNNVLDILNLPRDIKTLVSQRIT